jgi:hypothetical protein
MVGPVLVIPYTADSTETVTENGQQKTRTVRVTKELYLSPETNSIKTDLKPERKKKSIYESVLFVAANSGSARFAFPADFARYGISRENLNFTGAELRFGVSDARGLQADSKVLVNGQSRELQPGKGLAASGNSGFFTFIDWDGASPLEVKYDFAFRGNKSLTMVPRGGETNWEVKSSWPSPSFAGDFLPTKRTVADSGFTSTHKVTNLALGQSLVLTEDMGAPQPSGDRLYEAPMVSASAAQQAIGGPSQAATIGLIEPVDLYSQVDRSVKYGFLFIGFTFLAFLMFDVVAGHGGGGGISADRGRAGAVLRAAARLCRSSRFTWAYLIASGCDYGVVDGLFGGGAEKLAARALDWRAAVGLYATALCAAQPRGLFAADRFGAALRRPCGGDVGDAHIDWGGKREARVTASHRLLRRTKPARKVRYRQRSIERSSSDGRIGRP